MRRQTWAALISAAGLILTCSVAHPGAMAPPKLPSAEMSLLTDQSFSNPHSVFAPGDGSAGQLRAPAVTLDTTAITVDSPQTLGFHKHPLPPLIVVPDHGSSAILLGLSLLAIEFLRRTFSLKIFRQ